MKLHNLSDLKVNIITPQQKQNKIDDMFLLMEQSINCESFEIPFDKNSYKLEKLQETIVHLRVLKDSISRYGLTRSLLSFVDHDKKLSSVISTIPSLENLSADRSVKNSTDMVASLEASIADHLKVLSIQFKLQLKKMINSISEKSEIFDKAYSHLAALEIMIREGRVLDTNALNTKKFTILSKSQLLFCFNHYDKSKEYTNNLIHIELPNNAESYKLWEEKFDATFKPLRTDEIGPTLNTLHNHGYTSLDDFESIFNYYKRIQKEDSIWIDSFKLFVDIYNHTMHNSSSIELNKAASKTAFAIRGLALFHYWVALNVVPHILKALFTCSEKTN